MSRVIFVPPGVDGRHVIARTEEQMNTRKRIWALAAIGLCVALGAAVAASAAPSRTRANPTLAIIPAVAANPAQQAIIIGFKKQAQKLGYPSVLLGGEFNPQAQITAVNAAIQRKVAVLAIWPLDPKGIRPTLDRARAAGIKVLTMWTPVALGQAADFQYAEAPAAIKVAALAAAQIKAGGKTCKVGIIQGLPVVPILAARNAALAAGAKAAGCQILEQQVNDKDSADGALPIVQAWKTKHGSEMTGVLAYNDPSALGAVAAKGGNFEPVVTGMNGDPAALQAIEKGDMLATTTIPNPEMGNAMAYAGAQILGGKTVPKLALGKCDVITKANAAKYVPWPTRNRSAMAVRFVKSGAKWYFVTNPNYGIK
jgi:ABC-type sugar transport system substrate-binding protein